MSVIYKYPVRVSITPQIVEMPPDSKIISAIEQDGDIFIYALVPSVESKFYDEKREILVLGTGWESTLDDDDTANFIGTVKVDSFVWHVFELVSSE